LTACHCVAANHATSGNAATNYPIEDIKVTQPSNLSPGVTVPADALSVTSVIFHPTTDIALIKVPGLIPAGHSAMWMGPSAALQNYWKILTPFGYGINTGTSGTSGAGVLRYAHLSVKGTSDSTLTYSMGMNSSGQLPNHGDSGGPTFLSRSYTSGEYFSYITGIHRYLSGSTTEVDAHVAGTIVNWIQTKIGWLYIYRSLNVNRSPRTRYFDVKYNSSAEETPVWLWGYTGTAAQKWYYNPFSKRIINMNDKCLTIADDSSSNGAGLWMETCVGKNSQKWTFTGDLMIQNDNGKCITAPRNNKNGGSITMQTCNSLETQRWAASFQPPVK
jgi:hypothetical protein